MKPYEYMLFTNQLRIELFLRGIKFTQGNSGTFAIKNIKNPNCEYLIFINERGLCYISKGHEKNGMIDLIVKKNIVRGKISIEKIAYKKFLRSLDSDKIFKSQYGFSQSLVIDMAFVLCFDDPV